MAQEHIQAGSYPAVDLRDDETVRSTLLYMLVDWDGTDLKKVCGYLFTLLLIVLMIAIVLTKRWNRKTKVRPVHYCVIKPPRSVVTERGGEKKRIVAVLGGAGFLGSHVVAELLSRGNCHVYILERQFNNVSEEVRSHVDALIQVDLLDKEGLVNAFRGVDTVIHVADVILNVFSSRESLLRVWKARAENVIAAAQANGVKQLVYVSDLKVKKPSSDLLMCGYYYSLLSEQAVVAASRKKGLATCVLALGLVYGLRADVFNKFLTGQVSYFPMNERRVTYQPVEYAVKVILAAVYKLELRSDEVVGKVLKIAGWPTTSKEFYSLPEWGHKPPRDINPYLLTLFARLNILIVMVTGWAIMGEFLTPDFASLILNAEEEEVDNSLMQEALGVKAPPDIKEGVKQLSEKFKRKELHKKT